MSNMCGWCGHSLENNSHGFDQNDGWMEGDKLVHSGQCTYCRDCNPILFETAFKLPEGYRVWCHKCGRPPYNIVTNGLPGVGFRTLEESQKHDKEVHKNDNR